MYISLGSMCYTVMTVVPFIQESLPFDSINSYDNLKAVYSVLYRLKEGIFDAKQFTRLKAGSDFNKEGFEFKHFNPPRNSDECRQSIFERRFKRLRDILLDDKIEKTFTYYNRKNVVDSNEFELVKSIQKLFPKSKFIYFDRWNSFPKTKKSWFKLVTINTNPELRPIIHEGVMLLDAALKSKVYSRKEKKNLKLRLYRFSDKYNVDLPLPKESFSTKKIEDLNVYVKRVHAALKREDKIDIITQMIKVSHARQYKKELAVKNLNYMSQDKLDSFAVEYSESSLAYLAARSGMVTKAHK